MLRCEYQIVFYWIHFEVFEYPLTTLFAESFQPPTAKLFHLRNVNILLITRIQGMVLSQLLYSCTNFTNPGLFNSSDFACSTIDLVAFTGDNAVKGIEINIKNNIGQKFMQYKARSIYI